MRSAKPGNHLKPLCVFNGHILSVITSSRLHVVDAKVIESRSKEVTKNISVQNASEWSKTHFYLRVLVDKYVFHAIV